MEEQRSQLEAIGELARALSEVGDGSPLPDREQLSPLLEAIHPSDLADLISAAPDQVVPALFNAIAEDEDAAEVLALLDDSVREDLLEELSVERKAALLGELSHDDAADVLAELTEGEQRQVLAELPAEEAADLRALARHDPDSAGGLMTDEFVALRENQSVRQALMQVKTAEEWEDLTEVFVVDEGGKLTGVVELDQLLRRHFAQTLDQVMEGKPVFARVGETAEEASQRAAHYRLSMIPVVDEDEVLRGVITCDDVMETLEEEATEDMMRLAGSLDENPSREGTFDRLLNRLPFMLMTMLGTYGAAAIIAAFYGDLGDMDILRFVPMIAALAGTAGIQTSTTMIRGFATGDILPGDFSHMLSREVSLGIVSGISAGLIEFVLLLLTGESTDMQLSVPIAQASSVIFATALGTLVPFACWRLKFRAFGRAVSIDPALAAGPFITTLNDILSTTVALILVWILDH